MAILVVEWLLYYIAYSLAGLTLKLGDDLLDELNRPNVAVVPLALSGVLFGLIMTLSEWDLVLLGAIVIGVLMSGKVNKPQFLVGFIMIGTLLFLVGVPAISDGFSRFILLLALLLAAIIDERGNEWADRDEKPVISYFFEYRFSLKVTVLLLSLIWPAFLLAALGLWLFDFGYEIAGFSVRRWTT
ncbi:MAG: hypothetical protein ACXAEE_05275 [Candidatus Thorarchaeota archaeon]|jgi:hypothetical protein